MNPRNVARTFAGAMLLVVAAVSGSGCDAEVAAYPDNYYADGDYPPPDYVATTEPVYYGGRPAYWYHNRWFYRDGARWGAYGREPAPLAGYRGRYGAPARHYYGRPSTYRGGGVARPGRR